MPRNELVYHPLTLWNIPSDRHLFREEGGGLYSYIFIDDVRNHILPYNTRSTSGERLFQVDVSNPSLEVEIKTLFHTLSYRHEIYYQSLSDTVFDFVRDVAVLLLIQGGQAYFEIVDGVFHEREGSKSVHVLKRIHGKVIRRGSTYRQIVPKEIKEVKNGYIVVPKSKTWRLEISREFGTEKDIVNLNKNLTRLGKASSLGSEIITNQEDYYGFEFNKFHSLIDATVLRATEKWGWDMRMGINNQHALEYYLYYRMLSFGRSMAVLRNDLLSKMNDLLKRLGYSAIMSFSGIPNPQDYLDAMMKMEQRQISFKEVSDLIYFSM